MMMMMMTKMMMMMMMMTKMMMMMVMMAMMMTMTMMTTTTMVMLVMMMAMQDFWDAYHEVIPRDPGFADRHQIYQLYHYLNHYNLFGGGYRSSCVNILRRYT